MRHLILLCLLIPGSIYAETSLWRVSDNHSELFIGGTVHVLGSGDYPLPPEFGQAYQQADTLVLETDLSAMAAPEGQLQLLQRLLYSDGRTLKTVLDEPTYQALSQYSAKAGLAIESLLLFKPPMVVITLTLLELQKLGLNESGVDQFFSQRAQADSKPLAGLETPEQQLDTLERMGQGHENELILSTIKDMQNLPSIMHELKAAWRKGDMKALENIGITPMQTEYPVLYQDLLVRRNQSWLPEIMAMLLSPERELILVGALHLAGTDGVLEQLRRRGYTVEKY